MIKVFSVAEMVAAEKAADAAGNSYAQMMERAGRGVAQAIMQRYDVRGTQILVLVGPGNNGGDGLVAGRHLAQAGAEVTFYLYRPRDATDDENYARIEEMGLFRANAQDDQRFRVLRLRLQQSDMIIDALLGTGVDRPVGGELATLMRHVQGVLEERGGQGARGKGQEARELGTGTGEGVVDDEAGLTSIASMPDEGEGGQAAGPFVVAVDCPSGLNCDTGELDPLAPRAQLTVTFAGPKHGHFLFPGAAAVGELVVVDIGIGADLAPVREVQVELATAALARSLLPARPIDGHKGTFGKTLIVAGSAGYWGAPILCGRGAYRAGAGLVALVTPQDVRPVAAGQLPEATYPPAPDAENFGPEGARFIGQIAGDYDAMLVGPGLGPDADAFVEALLGSIDTFPPLVVDADGLNALARMEGGLQRLPLGTALTPHPGEMARLLDVDIAALGGRERIDVAREAAAQWGHVVLLKGAFTVVAAPDGRCTILPFANPLLGSAGSGDVLAGVITSLLGQGLAAYEGAVLGAYLHGAAGQLAREGLGDAGLLSGELADWVAEARRRLLA